MSIKYIAKYSMKATKHRKYFAIFVKFKHPIITAFTSQSFLALTGERTFYFGIPYGFYITALL